MHSQALVSLGIFLGQPLAALPSSIVVALLPFLIRFYLSLLLVLKFLKLATEFFFALWILSPWQGGSFSEFDGTESIGSHGLVFMEFNSLLCYIPEL